MTLATIAIPTFNRVAFLPRSVASALAQDYADVELVICDNASTDGTEAFCRDLAARDVRVRYLRQAENVGPLGNFEAALAAASGDYFMWLADDDWLDENYLTECIVSLERGATLAAGRPRWFRGDEEVNPEAPIVLLAGDASSRIRRYYRTVTRNSVFYGVYRTSVVRSLGPVSGSMGGDWLFVSLAALSGRVDTLDATSINRSTGGASDSIVGAGWTIPAVVVRHILRASAFARLGGPRRVMLAGVCGAILAWRLGVWFPLLAFLRRALGESGYRCLRSDYRRIGRRSSRSETVSAGPAGQATARVGSSQRTPAAADGT